MDIGLYIHIPFCRQKCSYCDFPSYSNMEELYGSYTAALRREIAAQGILYADRRVVSVYMGGGTPTVLPLQQTLMIINDVKERFSLAEDVEWTMEANPGTVTAASLYALLAAGINRISYGIQSFDDGILRRLGRIHTAEEGREAVNLARMAGFTNISLDLMFDLPGQSVDVWRDTLETAVSLAPAHISAYGLKIEEGTDFAVWLNRGLIWLPPDEEQEAMYDLTTRFLPQQGFGRYEISNYAREGRKCLHNCRYWQSKPYVGLGAAAHSYYEGVRTANTADVRQYIEMIQQGLSPADHTETTDNRTAMAEYCFLALRTADGINLTDFARRFRADFNQCFGKQVQILTTQGLIEVFPDAVRLSELGMKYGNQVFCSFLP